MSTPLMKRIGRQLTTIGGVLAIFFIGGTILAQSSASYNLRWHVMANGGQRSTSASYSVVGTIGQGVTSSPKLSSGSFRLSSGYWQSATVTPTATATLKPTATPKPTATATSTQTEKRIYLPNIQDQE